MRRVVGGLWLAISATIPGASAAEPEEPARAVSAVAGVGNEVRLHGLDLEVSVADGSGLDAIGESYRNELLFLFEPSWRLGEAYLAGTRLKKLELAGRFALTRSLSGTGPQDFGSVANSGPLVPCSNLTPSSNGGVIDPATVAYCHPTPNSRRFDWSDVWLTIRAPELYRIPGVEVSLNPSLRFILPSSVESQYETLRLGLTPGVSLSRPFWHERVKASYGLSFTKHFDEYTTATLSPTASAAVASSAGNPYDGLAGVGLSNFYADPSRVGSIGGFNVDYQWTQALEAKVELLPDRLTLDILYLYLYAVPFGHGCGAAVAGQRVDTCQTGDAVAETSQSVLGRPGHHDSQVFWATLSYRFRDWLAFTLAWINWAPAQFPDGSFRQPFISTNYDAFTTVQGGATVSLEKLAAAYF